LFNVKLAKLKDSNYRSLITAAPGFATATHFAVQIERAEDIDN
jgi:hypothetical protein